MSTTPFIITCAARTGSTMLRYMLDSHPEISCHGEAFKARGISRFLKADKRPYGLTPLYDHLSEEFKSSSVEDFIQNHLLNKSDALSKTSGLKFKTSEYFNKSFSEVSSYIRSHKEIKVIHLKRRDLLAQYVSKEVVTRYRTKNVKWADEKIFEVRPFKINIRSLEKYIERIISEEKKISQDFKHHRVHPVWYEDILSERDAIFLKLFLFLNVRKEILTTDTQKIIENYSSWIINYSEIVEWSKNCIYKNRMLL